MAEAGNFRFAEGLGLVPLAELHLSCPRLCAGIAGYNPLGGLKPGRCRNEFVLEGRSTCDMHGRHMRGRDSLAGLQT
jgi:hypothetical protein